MSTQEDLATVARASVDMCNQMVILRAELHRYRKSMFSTIALAVIASWVSMGFILLCVGLALWGVADFDKMRRTTDQTGLIQRP